MRDISWRCAQRLAWRAGRLVAALVLRRRVFAALLAAAEHSAVARRAAALRAWHDSSAALEPCACANDAAAIVRTKAAAIETGNRTACRGLLARAIQSYLATVVMNRSLLELALRLPSRTEQFSGVIKERD